MLSALVLSNCCLPRALICVQLMPSSMPGPPPSWALSVERARGRPSSPSARGSGCLRPEGLTGFSSLLGPRVAAQVDGESEEEQESAGTADEEEDGDESDLVTPACMCDARPGDVPVERLCAGPGGASGPAGRGSAEGGVGGSAGPAGLGELLAVSVQPG